MKPLGPSGQPVPDEVQDDQSVQPQNTEEHYSRHTKLDSPPVKEVKSPAPKLQGMEMTSIVPKSKEEKHGLAARVKGVFKERQAAKQIEKAETEAFWEEFNNLRGRYGSRRATEVFLGRHGAAGLAKLRPLLAQEAGTKARNEATQKRVRSVVLREAKTTPAERARQFVPWIVTQKVPVIKKTPLLPKSSVRLAPKVGSNFMSVQPTMKLLPTPRRSSKPLGRTGLDLGLNWRPGVAWASKKKRAR